MIQSQRMKLLNRGDIKDGRYVLYWMQASQRAEYNHALEYAIRRANQLDRPLLVFFGITDEFPDANERHYRFMLEGLKQVKSTLAGMGMKMVIRHESPEIGAIKLSRAASLVVVDRGYLSIQRQWRRQVAERIRCPLIQIESDVVIPVEDASPREEYAAATLRPKITKKLKNYLHPLKAIPVKRDSLGLRVESFDISDIGLALGRLRIDRTVKREAAFRGGTDEAKKHLEVFLKKKIDRFAELRNDPTAEHLSNMSPYLHFGQISPLYIALRVLRTRSPGREAYLEELIVRRELSMNFAFYNRNYNAYRGIPDWARKTLNEHKKDRREYTYTLGQLENGQTHDPYWNAAQNEMRVTGKMHGYMRMYWGKKIIEWSRTPEEAFKAALYLNNKYELDGRDPNGFTGVAWCFGKHDRAWGERRIFGKIRYMNENGLRRKFDADAYAEKVKNLMRGV
jgi:deoxyribodipyrimidine photo-lyase